MRKETKTGIVIGIVITAATVIYFAQVDHGDNNGSEVRNLFEDPAENMETENTPGVSSPSSPGPQNNNLFPVETNPATTPIDSAEPLTTTDPDPIQPYSATPESVDQSETENQSIAPTAEPETNSNTALDPFSNLPDEYPQQMNEPRYHSVKKCDSLYSISAEYFGNGKYWEAIYKANKDTITNASSLRIGWKLRIPSPEEIE